MGKIKEEKQDPDETIPTEGEELTYEEKLKFVSVIANPMATKKQTSRIYKLIKKASKQKTYLRTGLKEVQGKIRKGESGIVIFAGDVTPIEIMCHMPGVCEEKEMPYIYTPSRNDIGTAMGVKRGSLTVMIRENPEYQELYDKVLEDIKSTTVPV
ncbi:unnamed protein product [Meganyctiphanes norvegica]|uniref:Ribosomal protein eL8/eL30/eS12/Gadd45 domain-containing protein n=1 Tax=Meganyctiphanes norvegica TaxID=48144 RepID=A0AAV2QQL6_MEGNR